MFDVVSIGQADTQARKVVDALPKPDQVKRAVEVPDYTRIEPVSFYNENTSGTKGISAPVIESAINGFDNNPGAISRIVGEVNTNLQVINTGLAIEVDRELKQVIFKVIDVETGDTIKQIPSEELIRIAKRLKLMIENYANKSVGSAQLFMDSAFFA